MNPQIMESLAIAINDVITSASESSIYEIQNSFSGLLSNGSQILNGRVRSFFAWKNGTKSHITTVVSTKMVNMYVRFLSLVQKKNHFKILSTNANKYKVTSRLEPYKSVVVIIYF